MNILAFDTSFEACSVAFGVDIGGPEERLEAHFEPRHKGHAEVLMPMIEAAMARAGKAFRQIDRIAVTSGPGTFTGTRIGIAAARAMALATGAPIVTASSLEVMAVEAGQRLAEELGDALMAVAMDARRGSVYVQTFDDRGRRPLGEPALMAFPAATAAGSPRATVYVGSAAEALAAAARAEGRDARARLAELMPDAATLVRMAPHIAPSKRPPRPLYLRPADAKPQTGKAIERAS